MLKIGLTGGIASGKSTICHLFSHHGVAIIDADIIARQLVKPNQLAFTEIVATFGQGVIQADGQLDRSALRQRIFSDPQAKIQLEQILHPKISEQLQQQSDALNVSYCILAIPLLIESKLQHSVDRILVIDIEKQRQLERLCLRDKMTVTEAKAMINSQCSREQRLAFADDVIANNQSVEKLNTIISDLDQKYRKLANSPTSGCQHANSHGQYTFSK